MKKVLVFTFLIMIGMGVFFNSCSKEDSFSESSQTKKISIKDQFTLNKIFKFRDRISELQANPSIKSSEATTVDSAVWYLDATLNLSHSFISWETMNGFHTDSVFITIPKSGTEITYGELAAAYAVLKEKVKQKVLDAPGEDKELYYASLSKKSETDTEIVVKAKSISGSKSTPPDNAPFDGPWMYGDLEGNAPGTDPYDDEFDACVMLRDKTNEYRDLYIDDSQMLYIGTTNEVPYTVLDSRINPDGVFDNPNDPAPHDNNRERLILYQNFDWTTSFIDLVSQDDMNWYYHQLHNVIYNMVPNDAVHFPNANGKTFMSIDDELTETYGHKEGIQIYHRYNVEYRIGIYVGGKSEPESITE